MREVSFACACSGILLSLAFLLHKTTKQGRDSAYIDSKCIFNFKSRLTGRYSLDTCSQHLSAATVVPVQQVFHFLYSKCFISCTTSVSFPAQKNHLLIVAADVLLHPVFEILSEHEHEPQGDGVQAVPVAVCVCVCVCVCV